MLFIKTDQTIKKISTDTFCENLSANFNYFFILFNIVIPNYAYMQYITVYDL